MTGDPAQRMPTSGTGGPSGVENLSGLSQAREDLRKPWAQTQQDRTVLFIAMQGSAACRDRHRDLAGLAALIARDRMGAESVEKTDDGLLVSFRSPENALKSAAIIQQEHQRTSGDLPQNERIEIRIGVCTGPFFPEQGRGGPGQVAQRLADWAEAGEILLASSTWNALSPLLQRRCCSLSGSTLRGADEQLTVYRYPWAGSATRESPSATTAETVLQIDVRWLEDRLLFHLTNPDEPSPTVTNEYPQPLGDIEGKTLERACRDVSLILQRANIRSGGTANSRRELAQVGRFLYELLLPLPVRDALASTDATYLLLQLDDRSVTIPWEILHDGETFLALRFCVGRKVRTATSAALTPQRAPSGRPTILLISDPAGNLPGAAAEGNLIYNSLTYLRVLRPQWLSRQVVYDQVALHIHDADIIHYCGHATLDEEHPERSGWLLADRSLTAADIRRWAGADVPQLVFCNACLSGATTPWDSRRAQDVFGIAHAFLSIGVPFYIGTTWEVLDEPSTDMAVAFYEHLVAGESVGGALHAARCALQQTRGIDNVTWAAYVFYGDPRKRLVLGAETEAEEETATRSVSPYAPTPATRHTPDDPQPGGLSSSPASLIGREVSGQRGALRSWRTVSLAVLLVLAAVAVTAWITRLPARADRLIRAQQAYQQGHLETARSEVAAFVADPAVSDHARAEGYALLAEIENASGSPARALDALEHAARLAAGRADLFVRQGLIHEREGRLELALEMYREAVRLDPQGELAGRLLHRLQQSTAATEALRQLENLEQMASRPVATTDTWTTYPRTLTCRPFVGRGLSITEEANLRLRLEREISRSGVAVVPEDEAFVEVLRQHRIGRSSLADAAWSGQEGQMLAASVLLAGSLQRDASGTAVYLRLIDTASRAAWPLEDFSVSDDLEAHVPALLSLVLHELQKRFPIQGRIEGVEDGAVGLNIGTLHGVREGALFDVYAAEAEDTEQVPLAPIGTVRVVATGLGLRAARAEAVQEQVPFAAQMRVREHVE